MILIAHRGNISGPSLDPLLENTMPYLLLAIEKGYDVELDVWALAGEFYIGHNGPVTPVTLHELRKIGDRGWFHAKNIQALTLLKDEFNTFFHDQDAMTLTSRGIIWSHKGAINPAGIVCMPDLDSESYLLYEALGVCHDDLITIQKLAIPHNLQTS